MAKQAKDYLPAFFGAVPNRAIVDTRLTGTAFRLLTLYSFHDRSSIITGRGDGCTASNKTLSGRLGCDYTTLIKLRASLRDWGYVILLERRGGRRLERVRVIPDHLAQPECWPFDQCYIGFTALQTWGVPAEKVGDIANLWRENNPTTSQFIGDITNFADEKIGEEISETRANPPEIEPQYIPPRGERYSSEEGEHHPLKGRALEIDDAPRRQVDKGCSMSLRPHLPPSFDDLPSGAQVAHLERAFNQTGRNAKAVPFGELQLFTSLLSSIADAKGGDDVGYQAERLLGEMDL